MLSDYLKKTTIDWQQFLSEILMDFGCTTGTIHIMNKKSKILHLKAHQGVPEFLLPKISEIEMGKGMAGIAAERRQPVQLCNLQTDISGVARPAAKETKVEGSIAVPMLLDGELYGTLGIAKPSAYMFTEKEIKNLMDIGAEISQFLSSSSVDRF